MNSEWVVVKKVVGHFEADIIKGKLESLDIPVQILGEAYSKIAALEHGEMSIIKILVPPEFEELAIKYLNENKETI